MSKKRKPTFDMYRFQIVPRTKHFQFTIPDDSGFTVDSPEQLIREKNRLFANVIKSEQSKFYSSNKKIVHKLLPFSGEEMFFILMGREKTDTFETADLSKVPLERYPQFHVIIDNDKNSQVMLVEHAYKAQANTQVAVNTLVRNFNRLLRNFQLQISIQPIYELDELNELFKEYEGKIRSLAFHFVRPNLAAIHGSLPENMKEYLQHTNGSNAVLKSDAAPDSTLEISPDDETIIGLNEYCSKGGGHASIRVKGRRKVITTGKSVKSMEIDIENLTEDAAVEIVKALIREMD